MRTLAISSVALSALITLSLFTTACKSNGTDANALQSAHATKASPGNLQVDKKLKKVEEGAAPTASASTSGQSDPLCLGPIDLKPSEKRKVGAFEAELAGYSLTFTGADDGTLVLGVIGDIKEDSGENLFNLDRYLSWYKSQGVEAIVMTGDTAETEDGLVRVLGKLASLGVPVLGIIGNRESRSVFADGLAAASAKYPNVFSLNVRRLVRFPGLSLLSLPGYHDPRYMHSETGCVYHIEDVEALEALAKETSGMKALVSHGPPRGSSKVSIDVATEAGNVGDPNLNTLMKKGGIALGFFGNIQEAGGHATDPEGKALLPEKTPVEALILNPGPADSVGWTMNDGSVSNGMAAVVKITGSKASYEMKRLPALNQAELAEAAKLAPAKAADPKTTDAPAAEAAKSKAAAPEASK